MNGYCGFDLDDPNESCLCWRRHRDALWRELAGRMYPLRNSQMTRMGASGGWRVLPGGVAAVDGGARDWLDRDLEGEA